MRFVFVIAGSISSGSMLRSRLDVDEDRRSAAVADARAVAMYE